ncbi:hypothetical protein UFOVP115_102 [uncultured Caudovirales phage]|uniref:Uncharacterized protein n=1 Tax=uncultured Caudovirales phage TaxID=2100421 RepID=A0A6J5L8H3_9CAUD|nr:hypothetical protein UFOVP115_102 [uncultured Caudovirales phage]
MWENQENQTPAENAEGEVKLSYAELETKLAEAERLRAYHEANAKERQERITNRKIQIDQLEQYLRDNWDSLDTHAEEIAEIFNLSMTSTKTFTFEVSVTVEVEAKSPAYDWNDFDGSQIDLDISASVAYGYRDEIDDATVEDSDITSCEEA